MTARLPNPNIQFADEAGTPYADGKLYFYLTGTTTPTDTYSDTALTTPNANPVVLDSAGRSGDIFLDSEITYKVVLEDADGNQIWTADPVVDPAAGVTAAFAVVAGDPNGQSAGTAGSVGGSSASVRWDILNNLLWVCTTTGDATNAVWTQVAADLSGALVATGVVTPATITGNQNDYEPAGLSTAYVARLASDASREITGIATGAAGRLLVIENIGSFPIILKDDSDTTSVAANRLQLGHNVAVRPTESVSLWYDGTSSRWRMNGPRPYLAGPTPGGRLTITSAVPVIQADTTAQGTIYYTPYNSNIALVSDGVTIQTTHFSELSQTLADATKSPAAGATNSVYDMFVWNDAGTLRCTRGPVWTSATTRGSGAGTSELTTLLGVYVNNVAITNGPAAKCGVYVGTIATDGSTQCNMMFAPTPAAGGTSNRLDVWNMYNRLPCSSLSRDSTNSWNYSTATVREANNSTSNRITAVYGLNDEHVHCRYHVNAFNATNAGVSAYCGVGLDSTTDFGNSLTGNTQRGDSQTAPGGVADGSLHTLPGIGRHFFQALEYATATGTTTWYGDNNAPTILQMGIVLYDRR